MRLQQLRLENLRAFERLELDLDPGWNVFVGPNGAGKTTLLEATYLLSHARSFRPGPKDGLVRHGAGGYSVYGRLQPTATSAPIGVGLARTAGRLEARVEGVEIPVTELLRHAAVVCFDPGSHELIAGPAEMRRRYLDWGVFHVEPEFVVAWRTFQRALKQRNALLRNGGQGGAELDAWDNEFAQSGTTLAGMRARYLALLRPQLASELARLLPELGAAQIAEDRGWGAQAPLSEQLAATREDDLRRGYSGSGPHRADWTIGFERAPRREHLSRGQEKLCALACVLAQARVFAGHRGEWPVVCVDDLASELDAPHQEGLVRSLMAVDAQILITSTHRPRALQDAGPTPAWFHVEPGRVASLL